jgi:hypothetical protein
MSGRSESSRPPLGTNGNAGILPPPAELEGDTGSFRCTPSIQMVLTLITALASCEACHRSNSSPTAPTAPPATPAVTVAKLVIEGKVTLTMIGETSQLTATATFSDGVVKDVTSDTRWKSGDPSAITVSAKGLLTVLHFGASEISGFYPANDVWGFYGNGSVLATATQPGTFAVGGWVREPGHHGGTDLISGAGRLSGVQVFESHSGIATTTNGQGEYSLGGLTSAHLRFEKDAYESTEMDSEPNSYHDVAMQRIVRLTAGETVTPLLPLVPNDMAYMIAPGTRCVPCRLIRIVVPAAGVLHLGVTWSELDAELGLWVNARQFLRSSDAQTGVLAEIPTAAGELLVYVFGKRMPYEGARVPFTVATSVSEK